MSHRLTDDAGVAEHATGVTTLELFFDLVFVFTITRVTGLVAEGTAVGDFVKVGLLLAVILWMYGGYAWLTNNIDLDRPVTRVALLVAMAAYVVIAMAVPNAFGTDAAIFAVGYAITVVLHAWLFSRAMNTSAQAIWRIAPFNLIGAALLIGAAFFPTGWRPLAWAATVAVFGLSTVMRRTEGFQLRTSHFAERHGLVVLIVLGESLLAVGERTKPDRIDARTITVAMMALVLIASMWWAYFDSDSDRAERQLAHATDRPRMALKAYGYAHYPIVAGVVVLAAGLRHTITDIHINDSRACWSLAAGVALYLTGSAAFRSATNQRIGWFRPVAALLVVATVPAGLAAGPLIELAAIAAITAGLVIIETAGTTHPTRPEAPT